MELQSIKSKNKKRIGRGLSAGQGKTAGRGTKGQRSRSGFNIPRKFEGGQTPLSMRLPVMPGFKSKRPKSVIITFDQISANYKNGETVTIESLIAKKLIQKSTKVKILDNGELKVAVKIDADIKVSKSAFAVIEKMSKKAEKPETQKTPAKKATTKKTLEKK